MNFPQAIATVFRKYAQFNGRASRPEFWLWMLFTGLVAVVLSATTNGADGGNSSLAGLWGLAVLVPTLAVEVRRLRDAGFRWGHAFWGLIPFAGLIILGVLNAQPSRTHVPAGANQSTR